MTAMRQCNRCRFGPERREGAKLLGWVRPKWNPPERDYAPVTGFTGWLRDDTDDDGIPF